MNTKKLCDNCGRKEQEMEENANICPSCLKFFKDAVNRANNAESELHRIRLKAFRECGEAGKNGIY